jgi:hypothetical protein
MDEIAKIYLHKNGKVYRVKVFEKTIWIERQRPHGDNLAFDRSHWNYRGLYWQEDSAWNLDALNELITDYERDLLGIESQDSVR